MITTTHDIVRKFLEEHDMKGKKVLDVGSFNVNGALDVQFKEAGLEYTGVDMRKGQNVDIVVNGHELSTVFEPHSFDLVVCFDTLEHDDLFWLTLKEMRKILKSGGWLIIGAPSINHPIHQHPKDYYRFTTDSFEDVFFKGMENVWIEDQYYGDQLKGKPDQVFGYGQQP